MVRIIHALLTVSGAVGALLPFGAGTAGSRSVSIAVIPLGEVSIDRLHLLEREIEAYYNADAVLLDRRSLPPSAWYEPRGRYRADTILRFLDRTVAPTWDKIVAVTSVDISTTNGDHVDWGVLGLGQLDGRACVISSFRARGKGQKVLNERLAKIALHELGHTFGLPHCLGEGTCFMKDARGKIATIDGEEKDLCDRCRSAIAQSARRLR